MAWGTDQPGQFGFPHLGQSNVPVGISGVISVGAGAFHSLALVGDCNGNGIPDACDVDCAWSPHCATAGCGQSLDCNENWIPDECDGFVCNDHNICSDDVCTGSRCLFTWNTALCDDGNPFTVDDICNNGTCMGIVTVPVFGDINNSGGVNLDDILCILSAFGGNYACAGGLANADIMPCGGNGLINIDDILAILQAFGGANLCP